MAEYMSTLDYLEIDTEAVEEPLAASSSLGSSESTESCEVTSEKMVPYLEKLKTIAFEAVLGLLEDGYWVKQTWFNTLSSYGNPFCKLDPEIINKLAANILDPSQNRVEIEEMLRPLVTSGLLTKLDIYVKNSFSHEMSDLLFNLPQFCENLRRFTLYRFCYRLGVESEDYDAKTLSVIATGVGDVVDSAINLEILVTDAYFDISAVQKCKKLHTISLNTFPCEVRAMIPVDENNELDPNASNIENIYIERMDDLNRTPAAEVAFVLKHLPKLKYIQWNLGDALELMHVREFSHGKIAKRYPFEKAYLVARTVRQAKIFSMTCQNVKELHLFVLNSLDLKNMWPLGALKNLTTLILNSIDGFPPPVNFDFSTHCFSLVKHIGKRLKVFRTELDIRRADFVALNYLCPVLKVLKLSVHSDVSRFMSNDKVFKFLTELRIIFKEAGRLEPRHNFPSDTLVSLLSSCTKLEVLQLFNACHLKDKVLKTILRKNSLFNLRELHLIHCNLTESSLQRLVKTCVNLIDLCFESNVVQMNFRVLCNVVHDINPAITVRPYASN